MQKTFLVLLAGAVIGAVPSQARADWYATGSDQPAPISVEVLSTSASSTIVRYVVSGVELDPVQVEGRAYTHVSIPGAGITTEAGMPELPRLGRGFAIPASSEPEIRVISSKTVDLRIAPVLPSKGRFTRAVNPSELPFTFSSAFYSGSGPAFPLTQFSLSDSFYLRKVRGVNVAFYPVQVDPATGAVSLTTEATIEIRTPNRERALRMTAGADAVDEGFMQIFRSRFANFGLLENSRISHFIKDTGRVLVISHPSFVSSLKPFVEWKTRRGMSISVVTTNDTGKTAAQIAAFIKKKYQDEQISYVHLVGDAEFVPYQVGKAGNASGAESDPSYALVEGNDEYPDLVVSRFSVKTTAELDAMVAKTVAYERDPDVNGDWYAKASGIASAEGDPTDYERAEILRKEMESYGYTVVDKFYDPSVSKKAVVNAFNEGRGFVNYIGHGSQTSWGTTGFSNSDVDALKNAGKNPVIVSVACVNGEFGYGSDSFAERWLKNGNRGAIAMFASSTNQAWVPPTVGQKAITELMIAGKYTTVGALFFHGSIAVLEDGDSDADQTFETWHVFGDGTLQVRTKKPEAIRAQLPTDLQNGASQIVIETGEAGIQAGVVQSGELLGAGVSGKDGRLTIQLSKPASAARGPVALTLTGFNKIPLMGDVAIR